MVSFYRIFKTFYSRGRGRHQSSCLVNVGCENSCFYRFRKWFRNFKTIDSEQARYEDAQVTCVSLCKVYWGLLIALYTLYTLTHFTDTFFYRFPNFLQRNVYFPPFELSTIRYPRKSKRFYPLLKGSYIIYFMFMWENTLTKRNFI